MYGLMVVHYVVFPSKIFYNVCTGVPAPSTNERGVIMKFDITWTITSIIAVSSFLSPVLVAIINNRHQRKMRKMELEHDIAVKKLTIHYEDKKKAFSDFLFNAGIMCSNNVAYEIKQNFFACVQTASLFASAENQNLISKFASDIMGYLDRTTPPNAYDTLRNNLLVISASLNNELNLLQAEIYNCPKGK